MLSVIIPAYQSEKYLRRCVSSVLDNNTDLEIIIVNDGSTDGTQDICVELSRQHPNVKTVTQPNGGANAARRKGLELATGDYITFVDDDDYLLPHAYDTVFDKKSTDADIVVFGVKKVNESGKCIDVMTNQNMVLHNDDCKDFFYKNIDGYSAFLYNKVFRKQLFSDVAFINTAYGEDLVVTTQLFHEAQCVSVLQESLYCYVQTDDGMCRKPITNLKRLDDLTSKQYVYDFCKKNYEHGLIYLLPILCSAYIFLYKIYAESDAEEKHTAKMSIMSAYKQVYLDAKQRSLLHSLPLRKRCGYNLFSKFPDLAIKFL